MSDGSKIEWTDATWNPTRGCDKVSPGCKHCYAETFAERWRGIKGHPFEQGFDLRLVPEALSKPLRWKKPRKIFVNSMSDLFHEEIPNEYIAAVFGVMAACQQHVFQILTKRAERLPEWFAWVQTEARGYWHGEHGMLWKALESVAPSVGTSEAWEAMYRAAHGSEPASKLGDVGAAFRWPLPNVHLGISAENQQTANERIPYLLLTPAAVRWVSAEPLLGPIDFGKKGLGQGSDCPECGWMVRVDEDGCCATCGADVMWYGLDWVVVGGESGQRARPCDVAWIRSIVEQCKAAGKPAFVKQLGANLRWNPDGEQWWHGPHTHTDGSPRLAHRKGGDPAEWPEDLRVREMPRTNERTA